MCKIAFMTYAHNAEKSLKKTVESVLNQTHDNLVYYLIDNASTDETWDIMQEYAAKDNRIRVIRNENSLIRLPEYINNIEDCEYFAVLDADDSYIPEFAEKMINFIEKENLDMAKCGSCFHTPDGQVKGYRISDDSKVFSKEEIVGDIIKMSSHLRTMWGAVYHMRVMRRMDFSDFDLVASMGVFYSIDTIFCLAAVNVSDKIGLLNEVLHFYLVDSVSDTFRYNTKRFDALIVWIGVWIKFIEKYEQHTKKNILFIAKIYSSEIRDLLQILIRSDLSRDDRTAEIEKIMQFPITNLGIDCFPEIRELMEQCLR